MIQSILIGIAAGFASALLFLAPESGSMLAFPLLALTGLPIAIAGLGWGLGGGAIATAVGAGIIGLYVGSLPAVVIFLALFTGPIVWLVRLAAMWRQNDAGEREWYPLGRLLFQAAVATGIGLIIAGWSIGYDAEAFSADVGAAFVEVFTDTGTAEPVDEAAVRSFAELYVALLPFTLGLLLVTIAVVNMWIGAKVARASGRLERPDQRLWTAALPNEALIGAAIATALAFILPGTLGDAAGAFSGAFSAALVLIGLAVLHAITLGMAGRGFLLGATYVVILISGLPLLIVAFLGAAESFFQFRARKFRGAPPPT